MKGVRTRGVLPYVSHIGMYRPKGRVFGPFWSENTLTMLVWNRVWFFEGNTGAYMNGRIYRFNSK